MSGNSRRECVEPGIRTEFAGSTVTRPLSVDVLLPFIWSARPALPLGMNLSYNQAQTRIVQRLLAGSGSGWPGLIRIYTSGAPALTEQHRKYVTRQLREFRAASEPTTDAVARAG
jgi:hypothetical protein